MDCNEAREKIDLFVDDMLDDAEKQRLKAHVYSCPACKKALDDAVRLKQALGSMDEVEPPAGLAASAVKKARRRRIPVYAYASVAAAAVIALVVVLRPPVPRIGTTIEDAAEQKMYAAEADLAGEDNCAGLSSGEEIEDGTGTESFFGIPAPEMNETESYDMEAGSANDRDILCFASEAEFAEAITAGTKGTRGFETYYRPAVLPGGAELAGIEVSDYSVRWIYGYGADRSETIIFEWYLVWTADDIGSWNDQTLLMSDNLARSFRHSGDHFWSCEGFFNGNGEMEAGSGTAVHVYWTQSGAALHAQLPASFTEDDILTYCVAEQVRAG